MTEERRVASADHTGTERPGGRGDDGSQDRDDGRTDRDDALKDRQNARQHGDRGGGDDGEDGDDEDGERPDDHLDGVEPGAGCTEIWEHLSRHRR